MSNIILIIISVSILVFLTFYITDIHIDMVYYKQLNECNEKMIRLLNGKIKAQDNLIKSQDKYIKALKEFIKNEHTKNEEQEAQNPPTNQNAL